MNIVDFTNKFQEIEIKYNFFDYKDSLGVAYWDIVRFDVFYAIYFELTSTSNPADATKMVEKTSKKNKIQSIKRLIKYCWSVSFKNYDYLIFICSRYKNEQGLNFDASAYDILNIIYKQSLVFETFLRAENYLHEGVVNYDLILAKIREKIYLKRKTDKQNSVLEDYATIYTTLCKEFAVTYNFENLFNELIGRYKFEYKFYIKLFKKLKPKYIFVIQNGIQKGMFAAAKELNIELIEIQHGLIGYIHPAYSYPQSIKHEQLKTLPEKFVSFGSFWTDNLHFPVKEILAVGNTHLSTKISIKAPKYDLTFIFADIYKDLLLPLVKALILSGFKGNICIKLHSNQNHQLLEIKDYFSNYPNIKIITNQTIEEVLAVSKLIVAIQSTVVYQALHNNIRVLLYKKLDYQTHFDVFNDPLVHLIDSASDLIEFLSAPPSNSSVSQRRYFEEFHDDVFRKLFTPS